MKVIYNITVLIDLEAHDEWRLWMLKDHIPEVMNTGCFESWKMSRILGTDESKGINYAVQYICTSMDLFLKYRDNYSTKLQRDHSTLFKERYVAFRTLMEITAEGINESVDMQSI